MIESKTARSLWGAFTLCLVVSGLVSAQNISEEPYSEQYRPQFHFTPEENWMNDPNGLVYHDGRYHLFYQYNPHGDQWGNMSWGHAISDDLLHWEEQGVAIPVTDGVEAWSGSAVVDHQNTTGFGSSNNPPLVAIYTGHEPGQPQTQYLAYSTDNGDNWTIYDGNPVLDIDNYDFRDPKVFWHDETDRWIMVVARAVDRVIDIYGSDDLKDWELLSEFGPTGSVDGVWECPDLFELPVDGDPDNTRWVLQIDVTDGSPAGGTGAQYFIGDFDGEEFIAEDQVDELPDGEVFDDFEREDHGNWQVEGDAFGDGPAAGTLEGQQPVVGFLGEKLINSFHGGDETQGSMTSPEFTIDYDYINFLIGGGNHPGEVGMDLIIDDEVVYSATGDNSERLDWKAWDVRDYTGEEAHFEIYDHYSGGWGHILIDHIMFADEPMEQRDFITQWVDWGADFYATQSWSDIPEEDGRRIWIAWMSNWLYAGAIPTSPWRGVMSIPREVGLTEQEGDIKLTQKPIREIENIKGESGIVTDQEVTGTVSLSDITGIQSRTLEIKGTIDPADTRESVFTLDYGDNQRVRIGYKQNQRQFFVNRTNSGDTGFHGDFGATHRVDYEHHDDQMDIHILVDWSSVEVFVDGGTTVFSNQIFPRDRSPEVRFSAINGTAEINELQITELSSVWGQEVSSMPEIDVPDQVELKQNYPNPFNPSTNIRFSLPETQDIQINIYDLKGRQITTLIEAEKSAGEHQVQWEPGENIASGVYFYRLQTDDRQITRQMMFVK